MQVLPLGSILVSIHERQVQLNFRVVQILGDHPVLALFGLGLLLLLPPVVLPLLACVAV